MVITMPLFGMLFFLLVLVNASFIGEWISLLAAFELSIIAVLVASTEIIIYAVSSIYVYNRIGFGVFSKSIIFQGT